MAGERLGNNTEVQKEKDLSKLSSEEVLAKYTAKVTKKDVAKKYLDKFVNSDNTSEALRYISDNNENVTFGQNMKLNDLVEEEAYAYIAYMQDMMGLKKVDGIIGSETTDKLNVIYKERIKVMEGQAEAREWLLGKIDDELINNNVGNTLSIPDLKKSKAMDDYDFKLPEFKGISKEKLAMQAKKAENRSDFRRREKRIPELIAKYDIQIEGGTPDLVAKAKVEKSKIKAVQQVLANKNYYNGLKAGNVSLEEALLVVGIDPPVELLN
jgi:hypothetical protein